MPERPVGHLEQFRGAGLHAAGLLDERSARWWVRHERAQCGLNLQSGGMMSAGQTMRLSNGDQDRIVRDQQICGGEPVFRGTRVTLRTVLASLAAGDPPEEILAAFPTLQPEDIRAAIAFAAASAEEDLPIPPMPQFQ